MSQSPHSRSSNPPDRKSTQSPPQPFHSPLSPSLAALSFRMYDPDSGSGMSAEARTLVHASSSSHLNADPSVSPEFGVDPARLTRQSDLDTVDVFPAATAKRMAEYEDSHPRPRPESPRPPSKKQRLSPIEGDQTSDNSRERDAQREREPPTGAKRAAQACLRCRRQKLRCLGGWPCDRCKKSNNVCDFDKPGTGSEGGPSGSGANSAVKSEHGSGRRRSTATGSRASLSGGLQADNLNTSRPNPRLEQLESSVANLLAGLAGGSSADSGAPYPRNEMLHQLGDRIDDERAFGLSSTHQASQHHNAHPQGNSHAGPSRAPAKRDRTSSWGNLPPPTHVRPREVPRFGPNPLQPTVSPVESGKGSSGVRFSTSPGTLFVHGASPSTVGTSAAGQTPDDGIGGGGPGGSGRKRQQEPETSIKAATESLYEAPFKELLHPQARGLQSRVASRAASPDKLQSRYDGRFGWERDDPVNTGLVDVAMAQVLFQFFIEHCHPFFPIVNVALDDAFTTIRQSPPLISAMLAIAARFYVRYLKRMSATSHSDLPLLDPAVPAKLANLAEMHLAQTLLRKQHALSDAQATLLLSAWGVQPGGKGADSWVVTGHAARVMRRLGVHKVLAQAAQATRTTDPDSEDWDKLETFMPQWRTWLGWFAFDGFLTLGFGRPQSTQFETVDESGFLNIRLNQPLPRPGSTASTGLYGDVYIAGWTQLTQIGRDLFNWGEMLVDPERAVYADLTRAEMFEGRDLSVAGMFRELNARLDEWSRMWVWSGSPYALYLGSSARIARLQAEHMRLCLNSYALKAGPDEDELVGQCLKKALNAAMSTIQTHFESSQTDLALSFATDYLTITLAQAATFLIRITKSPETVQRLVGVDHSVVAHYLRMSVDLLESADLSETKLATFLARTIRDVSRAAGITVFAGTGATANGQAIPSVVNTPAPLQLPQDEHTIGAASASVGGTGAGMFNSVDFDQFTNGASMGGHALGALNGAGMGGAPGGAGASVNGMLGATGMTSSGEDDPFDLENYLQLEQQLDLGYLLGLPGDNGNQGNQGALNYGTGVFEGEFGFGMGGMGVGVQNGGFGNGIGGFNVNMGFLNDG